MSLLKSLCVTLLISVALWSPAGAQAAGFEGQSAPDFSLPDQHGQQRTLADFRGKWLVLYFYPKDNTPGCTTEAKNFVRDHDKYRARNTEIVGVSLDDIASHKDFADTVGAKFPLLADTEKKAATAYKVLTSFGPLSFTKRQTFVINPEGAVVKHYSEVKADSHSDQLLADLQQLQAEG